MDEASGRRDLALGFASHAIAIRGADGGVRERGESNRGLLV